MSAPVDRSGKLSWCSNGLTGAEVQVGLANGVRGESLETDPRGELLDRAELAVCLDIIGAAAAVRGKYSMAWSCMLVGVAGPVQRPKAPWLPGTAAIAACSAQKPVPDGVDAHSLVRHSARSDEVTGDVTEEAISDHVGVQHLRRREDHVPVRYGSHKRQSSRTANRP